MARKNLKIILEVDNDIEAYQVVSSLAFQHKIFSARLGEHEEVFNKENTPFHFLKNNKKIKKKFRDIRKERGFKN